jgi:hypothetical protein
LPYRFRTKLEVQPIADQHRRRDFEPGFDSGLAIVQTETAWPCLLAGEPTEYFFASWKRDRLSVFASVSAAIQEKLRF